MLQKKIIWKLNIIDLLLIVIILLSILALIYKSVSGSGDESEYREYKLTYVCESAPIRLFDTINQGELCIDGATGDEVGELTDFEVTPIIDYVPSDSETTESESDRDSEGDISENADEDNSDDENTDEEDSSDSEDSENSDDRERGVKRNTPTPRPTPEPTRAEAAFTTTVEAAKAEHGIRINKNVYLIGQSMQLVIGNTVFEVYISDMQ